VGSRWWSLEVRVPGVDGVLPSIGLILGVKNVVVLETLGHYVILGSGPVLNNSALPGNI
jgi:hypothetical protein